MKAKRLQLALCAAFAAVCTFFGVFGLCSRQVKAAETAKITIEYGASARKDETNPGLLFKAVLDEYSESKTYGMLILPAEWLETYSFNNDYIQVLDKAAVAYAKKDCTPYQLADGKWRIALSLIEINPENYTREFIAIAYEKDGDTYAYSDYSVENNSRSIAFVAQMALENEPDTLTEKQRVALENFSSLKDKNGNAVPVTGKDYINYDRVLNNLGDITADVYGETTKFVPRSSVAAIKGSSVGGDAVYAMISKTAYSNITSVTFDAKVTENYFKDGTARTDRWGVDFITSPSDKTSAVGKNGVYEPAAELKTDAGVWYNYKYTVADGKLKVEYKKAGETTYANLVEKNFAAGSWYIDVELCPSGNLNTNDDVVMIDNFTVVAGGITYTDDFTSADSSLFYGKNGGELTCKAEGNSELSFGSSHYSVISSFDKIEVDGALIQSEIATLRTKTTYSNLTSIEFDITIAEGFLPGWGGMGIANSTSIYKFNSLGQNFMANLTKGKTYHAVYTFNGLSFNATFTSEGETIVSLENKTLESAMGNYVTFYEEHKAASKGYTVENLVIKGIADTVANAGVILDRNNGEYTGTVVNDGDLFDYETLVNNGTLVSALLSGGYAYIGGREFDSRLSSLQTSMLAMSGEFGYEITGNKQFALILNADLTAPEYLLINGESVSLYKGTTLVKTVSTSAAQLLTVAVTYGGRIMVKTDAKYQTLGNIAALNAFKLVALGGDGKVEFTTLCLKQHTPDGNIGRIETADLASYSPENGAKNLTVTEGAQITSENYALAVKATNAYNVLTKNAYEGITKITFDAFVPSSSVQGRRIWIDFSTSATPTGNKYTYSGGGTPTFKGTDAWYSYKYEISGDKINAWYAPVGTDNWTNFMDNKSYAEGANYVCIVEESGSHVATNPPVHAYVDNFVITANGVAYSDNFETQGKDGLFKIMKPAWAGYEKVADKSLVITNTADYESLKTSAPVSVSVDYKTVGLKANTVILNGTIDYIANDKAFAVVIGKSADKAEFIRVSGGKVSYCTYTDTLTVVKEIGDDTGVLNVKLTRSGKLAVNGVTIDGVVENICKLAISGLEGSGTLTVNSLTFTTKKYVEETTADDDTVVPSFAGEENIGIIAYGNPTVENWNSAANNPDGQTEEQWGLMKRLGFNKALALYEGRAPKEINALKTALVDYYKENVSTAGKKKALENIYAAIDGINARSKKDSAKAIELSEKYGIEYYAFNDLLYGFSVFEYETGKTIPVEDYDLFLNKVLSGNDYSSKAFKGYFLQDEPSLSNISYTYEAVKSFKKYSSAEPFVNLLPGGLKDFYNGKDKRYENYINYYFENIAPLTGFVSFDDYVLNDNGISVTHLVNLNMLAQKCKTGGYDLRTFIRASENSSNGHRAITCAEDLSFQIYANLAFGATDVSYFTYDGLVDKQTLTPTALALYAKKVNREILSFGKEYRSFKWSGVTYYDYGEQNEAFALLGSSGSVRGVSSIVSTGDALMGAFEKGENNAYIVMNYADPLSGGRTQTRIIFENATHAVVYKNGLRAVRKLNNGKLTLDLKAGEGTFIIAV